MDETSVAGGYAGLRGTKLRRRHGIKATPENISMTESRGHVTLAAFIASDEAVQRVLPQFLIGKKEKMNRREITAMLDLIPPWLVPVTYRSGWVDEALMLIMITEVGEALLGVAEGKRFVLVMDAFRAHMSPAICRLCQDYNLTLLYVPAKLTSELQPLDTHAFKGFKERLKEGFRRWRATDEQGKLSICAWFLEVVRAIEYIRGQNWEHAFSRCGLDGSLRGVTAGKLGRLLGEHPPPCGPQLRPRLQDVGLVLNKRTVPFYESLVPSKRARISITL